MFRRCSFGFKSLFLVKVGERLLFAETCFWDSSTVKTTSRSQPPAKSSSGQYVQLKIRLQPPAYVRSLLLHTRFFRFVTLDFCLGYSLHIVQEVKTTAVPGWSQWAHR